MDVHFAALLLLILVSAACRTVPSELPVAPALIETQTEFPAPSVRVQVIGFLGTEENWYADWFGLEKGTDVQVRERPGRGQGMYIDIATTQAASCSLTIYLYENARGEPLASVLGTWFQHNVNPPGGHLSNFDGDIYLEKRLGESTTIQLRFALSAIGRREERVVLMGGVTVVPESANETESR